MKTVQIAIAYHGSEDEGAFVAHDTLEMTEDELRAMTRHLSKTCISDVELHACVPVKNFLDMCTRTCKRIMKGD